MNYSLNKKLLATSCLVVSLSVSSPVLAMEEDKEGAITPTVIFSPIEKEETKPFYNKTTFGNWKFDPLNWFLKLRSAQQKQEDEEPFWTVLEEAALEESDENALEKLYTFSTQTWGKIDRRDEKKAADALRSGLKRQQDWVVNVYKKKLDDLKAEEQQLIHIKKSKGKIEKLTKDQEKLLSLHRDITNVPLSDTAMVTRSETFLEFLYPFNPPEWIHGFLTGQHKEKIDDMITRVRGYGYYRYWEGLYASLSQLNNSKQRSFFNKGLPFLQEGAALGDPKAMNDLYKYYNNNHQFAEAVTLCKTLAKEYGQANFMFNLAMTYMTGKGIEKDSEKAFEWNTKAADKGMERAIIELIKDFWLTNGPRKDFNKAFEWLHKIVTEGEAKNPIAIMLLARCYHYGQGVETNREQGFKYFQEAASLGEENALVHVALAYQHGNGVEKNLEKAIETWERVAARNPEEFVWVGLCYDARASELQKKNNTQQAKEYFKRAYSCYERAARENNSQAMYNMGCHHAHGVSGKKNLDLAKYWFEKSARGGYREAMSALGKIHLFGTKQNIEVAEDWLAKAADKESSDAMLDLGWLYMMIKNDKQTSFAWNKKAADLGSEVALYNCGFILLSDHASEDANNDEGLALSYLYQSAEKGYAPAMTLLGIYYLERSDKETNEGQQNLESAYFWLKKAAALDNFEAKTLLKEAETAKDHDVDDSPPSEDLQKCLENIENIENGKLEAQEELNTKNEKRPDPFEDVKEEGSTPDSSDEESEDHSVNLSDSSIKQEEVIEALIQIPPQKNDCFKNPKLLRVQLREAGMAFKKNEEIRQNPIQLILSKASKDALAMLRDVNQREKVTPDMLKALFNDPYFTAQGKIDFELTKSGWSFVARNHETLKVRTGGTHHNHNKTYKGLHRKFLQKVSESLTELFGV
ncbi:MAG: SEL1-like repeat protein [Proteobacteria bacterium]|nr:SEL1-like repeat protein [Pseudomonadota bacterium]